jgi:hypothetical protein
VNATDACCRIASGGEGVGAFFGEQPEARHGQSHALA